MRQLLWWMRARHAATSGAVAFAPPPLLASVTPATGPQAGGTTITLRGNLLDSATRVLVGGADCTDVRRISTQQCTAVTPPGAGTQPVTVITGGGQSTLPAAFAYAAVAPTVSAISPNVIDTAGGGGLVTITGTNLTGATAVTIGGTPVTSFNVVNATTITATPAARTAGANLSVVVTTSGGSNAPNTLAEYWSPSQIPSVDAYLDSNKGVTITTNVSTWTSQSAGSLAFTQPTVGNRPSQVASVFGSLPAIRFTPQQWVACTRRTLASGLSIFAVIRTSDTTSGGVSSLNPGATILGDANGANGYIQFGMSNGAVDLTEFSGVTVKTTRGSGFNDNQPRLIGVTHNSGTNVQTLYQGATQQGATATVTYPGAGGYEAVGTGYTNIDGWNGDLGAVVVVSGVISGADLTRLNSWARQRFGTP